MQTHPPDTTIGIFYDRFDEGLLTTMRNNPEKIAVLRDLAFTHTKDLPNLTAQLQSIENQKSILSDSGVQRKTAETLYEDLKISENDTWPFLLYKSGITSRSNYYWYGQEWRSKTAAILVAADKASRGITYAPVRFPGHR